MSGTSLGEMGTKTNVQPICPLINMNKYLSVFPCISKTIFLNLNSI